MPNTLVNYYEILGVDPQATIDEIKAQRYRMLLAYHPDHNKSSMATEITQRINAGWEILSDPIRRQEYDETLKCEPLSNKSTAPQHSPTKSRHRESRRRVRKETRQSREPSRRVSHVDYETEPVWDAKEDYSRSLQKKILTWENAKKVLKWTGYLLSCSYFHCISRGFE
jgi:curved DNA-binding protein CbpA